MRRPGLDELDPLADHTWSELQELARSLRSKDGELLPTLDAIVSHVVTVVRPAEYAGLILLQRGKLVPLATIGGPSHTLDVFQQETGEGPCIAAAERQEVVRIEDITRETRWPAFATLASRLEVASMLCVPLWVDQQRLGTLSLYGTKPYVFEDRHVQLANLYATHAALALSDAQRSHQLKAAMVNRDVIGQAKGILMERHRLTPDAAFDLLAVASQEVNLKLVEVARQLVETGELVGHAESLA